MAEQSTNTPRFSKDISLSQHTSSSVKSVFFQEDPPIPYPDPPFFSKTSFIQLGYGTCVSLNSSLVGMAIGYSSVSVPMLILEKDLNMTEAQISWFASILTLSSPIGCIISGYICDKFGRRMALITSEVPMAIGWLYIALATTPTNLIIGRAVTGVGVGMIMPPARVYNSEISLPNMRGLLGTTVNIAIGVGITVQAVMGMFVTWRTLGYINSIISVSLILVNMLLPETPYFVLMTDTDDNAMKTLKKFRSSNHPTDAEFKELLNFKHINDIRKLTLKEKLKMLITPTACKPFWIINAFCVLVQLSGVTVLAFWTIIVLKSSRSSVEPKLGNSLVATGRLFGSTLGSILTYSCKRRTLTFVSGIGVAIAFLYMAANYTFSEKPSPVPQICVTLCVIFACLGYYSMPMLIMSEVYPVQVRGILGGLSVSWFNLVVFGANMLFTPMLANWGFFWTMLQYGIWAILGVIILYFIVPETKDLTLQEIEEHYNKKRPSLIPQRKIQSELMLARQSGQVLERRSQAAISKR